MPFNTTSVCVYTVYIIQQDTIMFMVAYTLQALNLQGIEWPKLSLQLIQKAAYE